MKRALPKWMRKRQPPKLPRPTLPRIRRLPARRGDVVPTWLLWAVLVAWVTVMVIGFWKTL